MLCFSPDKNPVVLLPNGVLIDIEGVVVDKAGFVIASTERLHATLLSIFAGAKEAVNAGNGLYDAKNSVTPAPLP